MILFIVNLNEQSIWIFLGQIFYKGCNFGTSRAPGEEKKDNDTSIHPQTSNHGFQLIIIVYHPDSRHD
jgi:hypothetical protein